MRLGVGEVFWPRVVPVRPPPANKYPIHTYLISDNHDDTEEISVNSFFKERGATTSRTAMLIRPMMSSNPSLKSERKVGFRWLDIDYENDDDD